MKIQSLVFVTSAVIASLCQAQGTGDYADPGIVQLPKTAEECLLAKLPAKKIGGISQLVFRRLRDFDYLGVEGGFEVPWGVSWEKYFFHDFVLRKKVTDPDWSKAELFESMPVTTLFCSGPIDSEMHPWKTPQYPTDR